MMVMMTGAMITKRLWRMANEDSTIWVSGVAASDDAENVATATAPIPMRDMSMTMTIRNQSVCALVFLLSTINTYDLLGAWT